LPKNNSELPFKVISEDFIEKVFALIEKEQKTPRTFIDLVMLKHGLQITAHVGEYHSRRILDYDTLNSAIDPYIIVEYAINILLYKINELREHVSVRKKEDIPPSSS
jgi:hypothetical protein